MKIVHICLTGVYTDGYSYQENLLTRYHKTLGNDVTIIANTKSFKENKVTDVNPGERIDKNGIKIIRVGYKKHTPKRIAEFFRLYSGLYEKIAQEKPDFIFIHGLQFIDIKKIAKYAKNNNVKICVDNHADFSNSATNFISLNLIHKFLWRKCEKKIEPYVTKFYGVLPARVEFLKNVYKTPAKITEYLPMGNDDELRDSITSIEKQGLKNKLNISKDDFVIITGGKIDKAKPEFFNLLEAVSEINNKNIKVLIFGSIIDEYKERFESYLNNNNNLVYLSWLNHEETYEYLSISNIAIYPGRHSVLWEETVGMGVPIIVKYWNGTTHVNTDDNAIFLKKNTEEELKKIILKLLNKKEYEHIKKNAEKAKHNFEYTKIAEKTIQDIL